MHRKKEPLDVSARVKNLDSTNLIILKNDKDYLQLKPKSRNEAQCMSLLSRNYAVKLFLRRDITKSSRMNILCYIDWMPCMDRAYAMLRHRYDAFIPYGQRKEVDKDEIPILNVKNV